MRNLTKALTVVSLLAPVSGHSLGIGDIRVRSALNQNLSAEIAIVAARGENPSNIKVSLAPPEKFDEAGVPWSYFLSKIKFQPVVKPNGSMVIKVSSREALKEPYLNFLLEVSWPKGNLYREFTVLVDPPADYQSSAYQESVYQEPAYPSASSYDNSPAIQQEEYTPRQRPVRRSSRPRRSSGGVHGGEIVTRRNDTLWNVAERTRGSGVSVEQMMIALYEKNPHAFYQQNVNALSAGKRLKVPEKSVVQQNSRQQALAEFGRHNDAWNNNRSSVPAGETQTAKDEEIESQLKLEAPADGAVAANESVSPSSEQSSGAKNTASAQVADTNKEVSKETSAPVDDALQGKIAALEKQMATMQELIALKDKQLADLQNPEKTATPTVAQPQPEQVTPPAPIIDQTKSVQPVTPTPPVQPVQVAPIKPVQPVLPPKPVVKKIIQPPTPVVEESDSSLTWILGGVGGTLLSLFGWLWWRKKKIIEDTNAESMFGGRSVIRDSGSTSINKASGQAAGAISAESSFLNDFKASDFESFESFNVDHGDIDPVAEADVYLAYGRYQQAEDLINQAIKDFPDRDECKLKLLEIFHANSNKSAFERYAEELSAAGKMNDKGFWGKVSEWGKDINPESSLFSVVSSSTAAVFSAEPDVRTENVLFDLDKAQHTHAKPINEADHLGEATFEISDDGEESVFDAPHEELDDKHQEGVAATEIVESAPAPRIEQDFDPTSFDDVTEVEQDNEAMDFDLGPYPEITKKTESENTGITGNQAISSAAPKHQDDSKNQIEFESYDFDFNLDKSESAKPEEPKATETWDAGQTIDFAMDEFPETDTFGNDTMDFSFDLEPSQASFDKSNSEDEGFMVSDLTDMDELETKLDLARAYIDMGDASAAKEIIAQVVEKGSAEQKQTAQMLLEDLN